MLIILYLCHYSRRSTCSQRIGPSGSHLCHLLWDDDYVHDCQCFIYNGPDVAHQQKEICICFNEDTVNVLDVSNKASITLLSRTGYVEAEYTHQVRQ